MNTRNLVGDIKKLLREKGITEIETDITANETPIIYFIRDNIEYYIEVGGKKKVVEKEAKE